jgi:hypothetical protein
MSDGKSVSTGFFHVFLKYQYLGYLEKSGTLAQLRFHMKNMKNRVCYGVCQQRVLYSPYVSARVFAGC